MRKWKGEMEFRPDVFVLCVLGASLRAGVRFLYLANESVKTEKDGEEVYLGMEGQTRRVVSFSSFLCPLCGSV